ncbi:MAG TPA: aldo/keto reductase [Candidatus Binataceae bacterium]|nr:aldo/keto reductase [Candidatus Binataceae bacterium]
MNRRDFLKAAFALAAMGLPARALAKTGLDRNVRAHNGRSVPYRMLGSTGERVSLIGVGGGHLIYPGTDDEAVRIIRTAVDHGLNFMDNCWDYGGGQCEVRMGKALQDGYRKKVFLMTKIDGRNAKAAERQLNESLRRLRTDHLDLLQFHEIIRMNDPERVFAPDGAIHTATAARKAGKIRFIGFTGHKDPKIHLRMLQVADQHGFRFDAVQMPLNVMDAHYDSFEKLVLPVLVNHNIGVLGMKPMGAGEILRSGAVTPVECLHYAMNLPTSVVIAGIDSMPVLYQDLQAACDFKPMSEQETSALLAKTSASAARGKYELYKTTRHFDGTYANPQWLG